MFKDKVKKFKFFICLNIILATIIGIYAQDITYCIVDDSLNRNLYRYWITILTAISIALFLATPIFVYVVIKKLKLEKNTFNIYMIANTLMGILISSFSIFVLAMSWG